MSTPGSSILPGQEGVQTGCLTCRTRKIVCDEQRPVCRKCRFTGRQCGGYTTLPVSRRDVEIANSLVVASRAFCGVRSLPRLVTDPAFACMLERRYFEFFRLQTVRSTNNLVDSRFWDRVVLQVAHIEPAVKHAVLALSSLHQLSALPEGSEAKERHRAFAEKEHQKALRAAASLIESARPQDIDRVLIACIIFIYHDSVRGDSASSSIHMHSGRQIIANNRQRLQQTSRRLDLLEIEQALSRLDIPSITFQDSASPMSLTLDGYHQSRPSLVVPEFQTVAEARASLMDLVRWLLVVGGSSADPTMQDHVMWHHDHGVWHDDLAVEVSRCAAQLYIWRDRFEELLTTVSSSILSVAMLRLWHTGALAVVEAAGCGPQTRWDSVNHHFASIVSLAETIVNEIPIGDGVSFSLEIGYIDPLWLVTSRCRDPTIRRKAIGLLRGLQRLEGMWHSVAVAAVGQRWMELEEEGLPSVIQASDIPESRRLCTVVVKIDAAASSARLQFEYCGVDGELHLRKEEEVRWGPRCNDQVGDMRDFVTTKGWASVAQLEDTVYRHGLRQIAGLGSAVD